MSTLTRAVFGDRPETAAEDRLPKGDGLPTSGVRSIRDAVDKLIDRMHEDPAQRVSFGLKRLDRATRGVEPGELVIQLGRTASLKTMFQGHQLRGFVQRHPDAGCLVANLEMPRAQLVRRLLRMECNRTDHKLDAAIADGTINLGGFCERFQHVYFLDEGAVSLQTIEREAELLQDQLAPVPLKAIFVDHAGLVHGSGSSSAYERASATAIGLKQLARTLDVVVFAVVQSNRAGRTTDGEPVALEAARDSGAFEENADFVLAFGSLIEPKNPTEQPLLKLRLQKNRRGPCVPVTLGFDPHTLRLVEIDEGQDGR